MSIISSKNGNLELKVGMVLPLTLIDDSDFPVYDIYDKPILNQDFGLLPGKLGLFSGEGRQRTSLNHPRTSKLDIRGDPQSSDWLVFECVY